MGCPYIVRGSRSVTGTWTGSGCDQAGDSQVGRDEFGCVPVTLGKDGKAAGEENKDTHDECHARTVNCITKASVTVTEAK